MSNSDPWTTKRLLEWTTNFLKENGSESPRLDAEVLLAEAKGCQRIDLYTAFDQVPPEDQLAKFRAWIKERAAGKPVAYLVGYREFYSLSFQVNQHVLIPRPETELLVTLAVDALSELNSDSAAVCDVGTGSGCVAIAIAKNAKCSLTALDISAEAIALAEQNAVEHQVQQRIQFLQSDLFAACDDSQKFDLIVSNPPYIGTAEMESLAPDVKDFEPHAALFAGEDGTDVIQRLVDQSRSHLNPGGQLMFETSPIILDRCVEIVKQAGFSEVGVEQDLAKQPRVVKGRFES